MAIFDLSNAAGRGFDMSGTNTDGWAFVTADPGVTEVLVYDDGSTAIWNVFGSSIIDQYGVNYWTDGFNVTVYDVGYLNDGMDVLFIEDLYLHTTFSDLTTGAWFVKMNALNDTFYGNDYADWIRGGDGWDFLYGYAGNDTLYGDAGNDWLEGGFGADTIDGGLGYDIASYDFATSGVYVRLDTGRGYAGEATGDILTNIEDLVGSAHADTLVGDSIGNVIEGNDGSDHLFGQGGDDALYGDAGNDLLFGGAGNDVIQGGAGVDTAGFAGLSGQYAISGPNALNGVEGYDQLIDVEIVQFADGRMVCDVNDAAAVVYRMYDLAFGRQPDSFGQNGWTAALQNGLSANDMASAFAASPEFVATYGALNNEQFVKQLYRNVLDREGDSAGVAAWTNHLAAGTLNRGQVLTGFSELAEHVQKLAPDVWAGIWDVNETAASVARLYDATFNRLPDANGLIAWKNAIDSGMTLSTAADGFAGSAEFLSTYGNLDNRQFVEQLYHNVLDRPGEAAGVAGWTAWLNGGQMDRGDVLLGFSESMEHQINTASLTQDGIVFI